MGTSTVRLRCVLYISSGDEGGSGFFRYRGQRWGGGLVSRYRRVDDFDVVVSDGGCLNGRRSYSCLLLKVAILDYPRLSLLY